MHRPKLSPPALAIAIIGSLLGSVGVSAPSGADTNPSTADLRSSCEVDRAASTGTAAGVPAVAPGERVTLRSSVTLDAGRAYQDVVGRPDGSTYFASVIELVPAGTAGMTLDLATATFTIDGTPTSFTAGTQPSPDGYVLDSTGGRLRLYFPGDAAAMLANVAGAGLPSIDVPRDGTPFTLAVSGDVGTDAAVTTGAVLDVATCRASMSTGPSARTTGDQRAKVAVVEPRIAVEKTVNPLTVAPGSLATFTISLRNAASSPDAPVGTAYDIAVVDTLPPEMVPATSSGTPLADGATTGSGLRWNAGTHTLSGSVDRLDAGASTQLDVRVKLATTAAPASVFTNTVSAAATSLPGSARPERTYPPVTATATLTSAASSPVIVKTADRDTVVAGNSVRYTVTVTLPPNSHYANVTLLDVLPQWMYYQWNSQVTCSGCTTGPTVTDLGTDSPTATTQRFGSYLGTIDTGASPGTITWTYSAGTNRQFNDGTVIPDGYVFVNTAEVRANITDRLGGVTPRLSTLRPADFQLSANDSVMVAEPKLAILKQPAGPALVDPAAGGSEWQVTLTNTGPVDATDVYLYDDDVSQYSGMYTSTLVVLNPPAEATSSGNQIIVTRVPAHGSITVRYRIPWYPRGWTSPSPENYTLTNRARVQQYADPGGAYVPMNTQLQSEATIGVLRPDVQLTKELLSPATTALGTPADYRVTLTNHGAGSAANISLTDVIPSSYGPFTLLSSSPAGAVSCSGSTVLNCSLTSDRIAPGQTVSFDYRLATTAASTGKRSNQVTLNYTDGANRSQYTDATGVHTYAGSASVESTLVAPKLTLAKTPEIDDAGATIDVGGSSTFFMVATNTGNYFATDVRIVDPMPSHVAADLASATCEVFPAAGSSPCTIEGSAPYPSFSVASLAPGAELRVHLPVRHDGSDPKVVGSDIENIATLSALGFTSITDEGGLNVQSGPTPPRPSKTVSPTSAGPGDVVTYTVDVALQNASATVYDATLVDTVPDGLTNITPVSIDCVTGSCPTTLGYIGFEPSPNGGGRAAWFIGDQPLGTTGTVRVVYTAQVADAFVGGGIPGAGTLVRDGVPGGDPLKNAARVWFNDAVDRFTTAPASVPQTTTSQFTNRSVNTRVSLDITSPLLTIAKTASKQSVEAGDRSNPLAVNSYTLRITNAGSSAAHAVDVADNMANGELRDVVLDALPAGVTVVDGWTLADPATRFRIDTIGAGETVEITYTALPRPPAEMLDSRWPITNTATLSAFHSTAVPGGPGDHTYPGLLPVSTTTFAFTPQPLLGASGCSDPDAVGDRTWLSVSVANRHWLGTPDRDDVGSLLDSVLTVTLGSDVTFVAGSVLGTPANGTEAPFRDPDTLVVNADLSTTMTWNLGEVPILHGAQFLGLRFQVGATTVAPAGLMASLTGVDRTGATARGTAVGASTPYSTNAGGGCWHTQHITKTPDTGTIPAGTALTWSASFNISQTFHHTYVETGNLVDTLPAGFVYTPGTATFSDGQSAAQHHESIEALPDGRTRITWTGFTLTAGPGSSAGVNVSIPTRAADEATLILGGALPRGFTNQIAFVANAPSDITGTCDGFANSICDSGFITVESNNQPTIAKSVDHQLGPWGDTATYTVDVSVPANYATAGLFVRDYAQIVNLATPYWPTQQPALDVAVVSAACVVGCTPGGPDDIAVTTLPQEHVGYPLAIAWKTGEVRSDTEPRTIRIVYQAQTPEIDEVVATPSCSNYGMSLDSYYSCGRATYRNTVDLYSSYSSLAPMGAGWWNNWYWYGISYRGSATADFTASVPDVTISKQCGVPGGAVEGPKDQGSPTQLTTSALGVANVHCELTVTNLGPGPAYYVGFEDRPSPNSWYGYPIDWDIRSNVTPAPATVDSSPTNGSRISWVLPELAEGASYSATFDARASLPSWVEQIENSTWDSPAFRFSNTGRVTTYDPDDFGSTHILDTGGTRRSSTTWLELARPRLFLTKQVNASDATDAAFLTDSGHCAGTQRLDSQGHPLCYQHVNGTYYLDEERPLDYHLDIMMAKADELRTATVADTLPLGWSYVPGSARLDHVAWDALGNPVTASTPLFEPTETPSTQTQCEYWNINGYGDRLDWVFSRAATDQARALWDDSLRWTGVSAAPDVNFDKTYRITYQAVPTARWAECKPQSTPGWDPIGPQFDNQVRLDVTTTSDGSASLGATVSVRELDPPRFTKSPKNGFVTADGDAVFTLDSDNPQKFEIEDVTITDTVHDWSPAAGAPLYVPGTATVTDEFGDPVPAVETVVHRSTGPDDPSIITWTFDQRAAYQYSEDPRTASNSNCPVSPTPTRPWWGQCASRVRVTLGLHVPDDEADGQRYDNAAVVVYPERTYDPPMWNYDALGPFTYGAVLGDSGAITVVNPSPPPTPTKNGTSWATPNDQVDYWVEIEVPPGATYHDLAYTDVLPDGLDFVSIGDFAAFDTTTWMPASFPTPTVLGPVTDPTDHTTTVGVYYGDVAGVGEGRRIRFAIHARVADRRADGSRIVRGDTLTDTVTGYANEDDLDSTAPTAPVTTAQHVSAPASAATIVDEPALTVEKTANRTGPLAAGDTVDYTVRVRNTSNVPAFRVPVEDRPNAALVDVQLTGNTWDATKGWTADDPTLGWEIPVIYAGQTVELTYTATIAPDPQSVAAIVNTVDVGTFQARPYADAGNREYDGPSATNTLRFLSADLRLTKVPNPTGATPCPTDDPTNDDQRTSIGHATPWCVTVTNAGELLAGAVSVHDLLPASWSFDVGSATVDGAPVAPTRTTVAGLELLTWPVGDLAPGESTVIRYTSTPGTDAAASSQNAAWATANRPDGSPPPVGAPGFRASDVATASLAATGVEISKTPDRQMLPLVPTGGRATWTIAVTNPAATDLTGVVVTDHFPAGVSYVPSATVSTCAGSTESAGPAGGTGQSVTWTFPSLPVGATCTITVAVDVPAGLTSLTTFVNDAQVDSDQTLEAAANQAKLVVYEPALIGDLVWLDLDGDGLQDADEPGLAGVGITVDGTDIEGNPVSETATTGADGRWVVSVPPGVYEIRIDTTTLPPTWSASSRAVGSDSTVDSDIYDDGSIAPITVASGQHRVDIDAGVFEATASLSGYRWHDSNANGIRDAGEAPIEGETVTLEGSDSRGNSGVLTTVTDANGYYEFVGLPPASGVVRFAETPGFLVSAALRGTDRDVDSDADPVTRTVPWVIRSGQHLVHIDEGTFAPATVVGSAWSDRSRDGIRDADELPRTGLTVTLVGIAADGTAVNREGVTDADGNVTFTDVTPGRYALKYGFDTASALTIANAGTDDLLDSDADLTAGLTPSVDVTEGETVRPGDAGYRTPTNVAIAKTVIAGPTPDGRVTYRLRITNTGDLPTMGEVSAVDALPEGLTAVSADGGSWACLVASTGVTCTADSPLAPRSEHDIVVVTQIAPGFTGSLTNRATIRMAQATDNSDVEDDVASAVVEVEASSTFDEADPSPSTPSTPPASGQRLAFTGGNAGSVVATAIGAIVVGDVIRRRSRRRRRARAS